MKKIFLMLIFIFSLILSLVGCDNIIGSLTIVMKKLIK